LTENKPFDKVELEWAWPSHDVETEQRLRQSLPFEPLLIRVLVSRGYRDADQIHRLLSPRAADLHDPRLLPDYDKAEAILLDALANKKPIYVHGDFDADGITSTVILTRFIRVFGSPVNAFVPHRMRDGHGMTEEAVRMAKDKKAEVLITCDVGIRAHESLSLARELGMRTIVTDHHETAEELPEADAVVNPRRDDSQYPFDSLSGAGVAFKLCYGLVHSELAARAGITPENYLRKFSPFAAIGTVADVMPLIDENRVITALGLDAMRDTKLECIRLLRDAAVQNGAKEPYPLTSRTIGFGMGPRINAVGRLNESEKALDFMLAKDGVKVAKLMAELEGFNQERKALQEHLCNMIFEEIEEWPSIPPVIVHGCDEMHPGIAGLVAGKLREKYNRPAFVCSFLEDGVATCSGRSIPQFDMGESIDALEHLIHQGGGHTQAGGFRFSTDRFEEIREFLVNYANERLSEADLKVRHEIEVELRPEDCTVRAIAELSRLEPTGNAFPTPTFGVRGAILREVKSCRGEKHAFLYFSVGDSKPVKTTAWGEWETWKCAEIGAAHDLIVEVSVNTYQGRSSVEWKLRGCRPHQP